MSENQAQIVTGLVSGRGCYGWQVPPDDWTAYLNLYAWRDEVGLLHKKPLNISWTVSHEALRDHIAHIKPNQVIQAKLRLKDEKSAELVEILSYELKTDDELNQIAINPITFEHERLAIFVLNKQYDCYEANLNWQGQKIHLTLEASEEDELQIVLKIALELWNNEEQWNKKILDYAIQELLAKVWLETPISSDEFTSRMKLNSVIISTEESFSFWFDDGDMFGGHGIVVSGNIDTGLTDVEIVG